MFALSAAESTFLPVPLEIILMPVMQRHRQWVWSLAFTVTAGALVGSLAFYALSAIAFDTLGMQLVETMGWQAQRDAFEQFFETWGFWAIVIAGILPIPLQLAMIAAGAANYPVWLFCVAILLSRATRYYGIAWLVLRFGERAEELFHRHKTLFAAIATTIAVAFWALTASAQRFLLS